jgi:hypothetical protein
VLAEAFKDMGQGESGWRFVLNLCEWFPGHVSSGGQNIARALAETIPLIKTENRLCRNLARVDLTDRINRLRMWEGAGAVQDDTVLALDLGDLSKRYAKAMENLATVRDGSTGALARKGRSKTAAGGAHGGDRPSDHPGQPLADGAAMERADLDAAGHLPQAKPVGLAGLAGCFAGLPRSRACSVAHPSGHVGA